MNSKYTAVVQTYEQCREKTLALFFAHFATFHCFEVLYLCREYFNRDPLNVKSFVIGVSENHTVQCIPSYVNYTLTLYSGKSDHFTELR